MTVEKNEDGYFLRARRNLILMSTFIIAFATGALEFNKTACYVAFPFSISDKNFTAYVWMALIQLYFIWRFSVSKHGKGTFQGFLRSLKSADFAISQEKMEKIAKKELPKQHKFNGADYEYISIHESSGKQRERWHSRGGYKANVKVNTNVNGSKKSILLYIEFNIGIFDDLLSKIKACYKSMRGSEVFSEVIFPSAWSIASYAWILVIILRNI